MGSAVWLYMFLVDKITSINEKGIGKVLGGKPIKYDEIKEELGISQDTYTRWINKLIEYPYIEAIRTPYGISFNVFKAYKQFGNRIRENAESPKKRESAKTRNHLRENAESLRENAESNKTVQLDSTVDSTNKATLRVAEDKDIVFVIDLFKNVSPNTYGRFFGNTTERKAAAELFRKVKGEDISKLVSQALPILNTMMYIPKDCKAFKPSELLRNLDKILSKIREIREKRSLGKATSRIIE